MTGARPPGTTTKPMFPIEDAPRLRTSELPGSRRACLERAVGERPRDRAGGELVPIERARFECMWRLVVTLSRGGEARRPTTRTRHDLNASVRERGRTRETDPERTTPRERTFEPGSSSRPSPSSRSPSAARAAARAPPPSSSFAAIAVITTPSSSEKRGIESRRRAAAVGGV